MDGSAGDEVGVVRTAADHGKKGEPMLWLELTDGRFLRLLWDSGYSYVGYAMAADEVAEPVDVAKPDFSWLQPYVEKLGVLGEAFNAELRAEGDCGEPNLGLLMVRRAS